MFQPDHPTDMDHQKKIITEKITRKLEGEKNLDFIKNLLLELPELELYLVGGMTRDLLLGETVSKDYDFVARGVAPEILMETLKKLGRIDLVGRNFGVIKFQPFHSTLKEPIDIAFPRTEQAHGTGGYRDVKTTTDFQLPLEEDLQRRDLTINAIAYDLRNKKIVDPFHGQQDLQNKIIRSVGNPHERFQEDYSRMLRALRFACRFDFEIEPKTMGALIDLMPYLNDEREITIIESLRRKLEQTTTPTERKIFENKISLQEQTAPTATKKERVVPMETITKELLKTLKENPLKALQLFEQTNLLSYLLPELINLREDIKQWQQMLMVLENLTSPEFVLFNGGKKSSAIFILGVILHHLADFSPDYLPSTKHKQGSKLTALLTRLKLSMAEQQKITNMLLGYRLIDTPEFEKLTVQESIIGGSAGTEIIMLRFLETQVTGKDDSIFEKRLAHLSSLMNAEGHFPPPLITGQDIIAKLRFKKGGPIIADILIAVREKQLQDQLKTKDQALKFIKSYGQ